MSSSSIRNGLLVNNQVEEDLQYFINPVSKSTFEALPKIYGSRKKQRYSFKYVLKAKEQKQDQLQKKILLPHKQKQMRRQLTQYGAQKDGGSDILKTRFKTQMKSYDKRSTERLSLPKSDCCNKRFCFCNKVHQNEKTKSKSLQRPDNTKKRTHLQPLKTNKLKISKEENKEKESERGVQYNQPQQIQTRHKVMNNAKFNQEGLQSKSHMSLLDFLRNNQAEAKNTGSPLRTSPKLQTASKSDKVDVQIQYPLKVQNISVQTDDFKPNDNLQDELLQRKTQELQKCLPLQRSKKVVSSIDYRRESASERGHNREHQGTQYHHVEKRVGKSVQQNQKQVQKELEQQTKKTDHHFQLQKLRAKYKEKQLIQSQSQDDGRSLTSSLSSGSISKHIFDGDHKHNTVFHLLSRQGSSSNQSETVKKQIKKKEDDKFKFQKKSGLFIIPEEEQFVPFLKNYQPMNEKFNIKKLVRKDNFKVVPSDQGVFFGELINQNKQGKGLMVTERTIFEGKYHQNQKSFGCQKNVDGVYRGEFFKGVREGYGTFQWYNGQVFQGQWVNGTKNGFGIWKSPKGDFYEGSWLLNRQHGQGIYKHRLSTYRGYFANFLKEGHGEQLFSNGDKYVGTYKQGKPDGKGKYEWADGSYYEGGFSNGLRSGHGKWVYGNHTVYQGQFKNDFKHGYGKQTHKSGQVFEGLFKEGSKYEGTLFDLDSKSIKIKPQT